MRPSHSHEGIHQQWRGKTKGFTESVDFPPLSRTGCELWSGGWAVSGMSGVYPELPAAMRGAYPELAVAMRGACPDLPAAMRDACP